MSPRREGALLAVLVTGVLHACGANQSTVEGQVDGGAHSDGGTAGALLAGDSGRGGSAGAHDGGASVSCDDCNASGAGGTHDNSHPSASGEGGMSEGGTVAGAAGTNATGDAGAAGEAGAPAGSAGAGSCNNELKDPGERCCVPSDKAAFGAGLPGYFLSHVVTHSCLPPSSVEGALTYCGGTTCDGTPGCTLSFNWHDAAYDSGTQAFSALVDVSAPIGIRAIGGTTCTLALSWPTSSYRVTVTPADDGYALSATTSTPQWSATLASSGCGVLGGEALLLSDFEQGSLTQWESAVAQSANGVVASYRVSCAY